MSEIREEEEDSVLSDYTISKKLVQLHQSARSREIEFNLSFQTVKRLLSAKRCYYTGKPFSTGEMARTIDRVDSSLGYVEGNVVACLQVINRKKGDLTVEEITQMARKISRRKEK